MLVENSGVDAEVPLIAREAQLARLHQAVEAARRGHGVAMLVSGEAGIGKTRLLAEGRRLAEDAGLAVYRGRAAESAGAYRPLVEAFARAAVPYAADPRLSAARPALARILPGWGGDVDRVAPLADPNVVLAEALIMFIQVAAPAGALVLLDDVHWADEDTVSVLASLVDAVEDLGVSLLLSARAERSLPDRLRRLDGSGSLQLLPLSRLNAAEVRSALPGLGFGDLQPADLDRAVAMIDGLPIVLDEFTRQRRDAAAFDPAMLDPSRSTLAATVERRYAALDAPARLVLDVLAVIETFDPALLAAVTSLDAPTLSAALRTGMDSTLLVRAVNPLGVGWRHALIREVIRTRLLPLERTELARAAAEHLAGVLAVNPTEDGYRQAADVCELAGKPEQAAEHLVQAAQAAVRSAALDVATQDLARAQTLAGAMPSAALGVLVEKIQTMTLAGRAADAYRSGVAALSTAAGRGHRQLTFVTARAGFVAQLGGPARRLSAELLAETDDPESALLAAYIADATRSGAAVALGQRAAALAEERGRFDLTCEALLLAGRSARRHAPAGAEEILRRAVRLSELHDLPVWRVMAMVELGNAEMLRPPAGRARFEAAREAAVVAGMAGMVVMIDLHRGEITVESAGYRASYPHFARADAQARQLGLVGARVNTRSRLADCLVWAAGEVLPGHDRPAAPEVVDELVAEAHELARQSGVVSYADYVFGHRAWLAGEDATAYRLLVRGLRHLDDAVKVMPWWGVGRLLGVVQGDDPDVAFGSVDQLGHAGNRAAYAYGQLVRAVGQDRPHQEWLAAAEGLLQHCGFLRQVLHVVVAPSLIKVEPETATGWLREADAFCEAAGERALQRRVRRTMVELGSKVPRTGGGTVPPHLARLGLTVRETEVLGLINAGVTNTEIAERLVISVRTVESHVSNMLAKTGAISRSELPQVSQLVTQPD